MKLFCQLHPVTYKLSVAKGILFRRLKWLKYRKIYASFHSNQPLPIKVYTHKSLIRRKLGNVNMTLQENKSINLALAAPKINGLIIRPDQVFSFWKLVGKCTAKRGFKEGLIIKAGQVDQGIGGGMCQFTNLIHWMILHSPLEIIEHHHHNQIDMFPDYGRQIPFGTGTSIMYNYLDYQFANRTEQTFQLITYTTDKYLCGELRSDQDLTTSYHIVEEDHYFSKKQDGYYRHNKVYKNTVDKFTGNTIGKKLVVENNSKVLYSEEYIPQGSIKKI